MTAVTMIPDAGESQVAGFGRLLGAEWIKFRTVRGWVIAVVIAALLTAAVGVWATSGYHGLPCGTMLPDGQTIGMACPAPPIGPGGEMVTDTSYLVRQPLAGDGTLTTRVTALSGASAPNTNVGATALQPWAKAGIIIKASLRQGSPYAAIMVTGRHGVRMQYNYTGDIAGQAGAVSASPRWLRLVRSGDTLTGYDSRDGTHWTRVGTVRLAGLPSTVQAGLFVTSPETASDENAGPTLASAAFDHVTLSGASSGGNWTGANLGAGGAYQSVRGGYQQAGEAFTVRGSGDLAPAVANAAGSGRPADQGVIGAFAGLIVVIVVATSFVTTEYRRGMIRTTLAAAPRRSQVLVAKAVVIGGVTFAAGLAGVTIALLLGRYMLRSSGYYVFPVSVLTELRVVVGTAVLLALAAVLALAAGTIMRHSAGPITAVIALIVLPYFFSGPLSVLHGAASGWLLRITPAAAFAVEQSMPTYPQVASPYTPQYGYFPLSPLAGLAVLFAWAALAFALALLLLRRRDA